MQRSDFNKVAKLVILLWFQKEATQNRGVATNSGLGVPCSKYFVS